MRKVIVCVMSVFVSISLMPQEQYGVCDCCGTPVIYTKEEAKAFFLEVLESIPGSRSDTIFYYISTLESVTEAFGMSFDEFVRSFIINSVKMDTLGVFSPEFIYYNYFLPMLQSHPGSLGKRWIGDVFDLYQVSPHTKEPFEVISYKQPTHLRNTKSDLLFVCRGDENTNLFLKSRNLSDGFLVDIFNYIHRVNSSGNNKIRGLNFYFPDYNFKANTSMIQFAKSASLVIDSIRLHTIQGMSLYFSFDDKKAQKSEKSFLCGLTEMCDSIFLFNTNCDSCLFYPSTIYTADSAKALPVFSKIENQLRLARFKLGDFPENRSQTEFIPAEILTIAHSDYPGNDWEVYMIALLAIIALVVLMIMLYFMIPQVSFYLNKNKNYMIILILILCFELFLLLFTTIEAMSRTAVFDFTDENKDVILFMPLLLIFITPVLKLMQKRKNMP